MRVIDVGGHGPIWAQPSSLAPAHNKPMSNRGIQISLKDRIAALGLEGHTAGSSSTNSNSNQHSTSYSTGPSSGSVAGVRDKAARFESIGGVPVPRGSFGLGAPPAFSNSRKTGELYGNRIPSGGRSPGSSPGRSPADEYVPTEFTRIKLRSISSTGSFGETGEIDSRIQIVPPTPAFPPPEFSPKKDALDVPEVAIEPDPVKEEPPQAVAVQTPDPSPSDDSPREVELPPDIPRIQELDSIPESPVTDQVASTSVPPPRKTSTASKRRSLVLKRSTSSTSSGHSILSPDRPPSPQSSAGGSVSTRRSAALSPPTGSPRKARSQAPSRASSISSSTSVFTSPPSDQGEVSGGGIPGSPTLETVDVDGWLRETSVEMVPLDDLSTEVGSAQELDASVEILNSPNSPSLPHVSISIPFTTPDMVERKSEPISTEQGSPLEVDYPITPDVARDETALTGSDALASAASNSLAPTVPLSSAVIPSSQKDEVTDSTESVTTPVKDRRDLLAETASPAKVLRELRQLGMEKQSSVVIVSPRRASILSMMMPSPGLTDSSVANDANVSFIGAYLGNFLTYSSEQGSKTNTTQEIETPLRRHPSHVGSHSTELPYLVQDIDDHPIESVHTAKKDAALDAHRAPRDVSPTSASIMSIPQSFSGTSDASYPRLSFSSSLREMVSSQPTAPDSEPARASSEYTPSFLAPPSPHSNVPFVSGTQDDDRTMTPSPPPSFRSLYAAGRLPPSSRGPGPHLPSGKIPLLQRAVTLMSRSLPPIPKEELPPRRSSSAFHAIRSRTSSKAKREQAKAVARANASERASTSSDMTVTDEVPPKLELHEPRARTKSSPLVISTSHSKAPPVPPLPPIVVSGDQPDTPPIARMFMERKSDVSASHSQAPTAYRSTSPTPSISSAQASMSSCAGHPSRLFTPSFDEGIFDAFPNVPEHLPSGSVVARHSKLMAAEAGGRGHLGMLPNRSFSELEDHMTGSYSGRAEPPKSHDGHFGTRNESFSKATVRSDHGMGRNEPGNVISPVRRKAPSRKLIPGWYDDDDDDGDEGNETGWASVQVIRSRLM